MSSFIKWFDQIKKEEIFLGRKAITLSDMYQSKILTPTGFVITSKQFSKIFENQSLETMQEDLELPEELKTGLLQAHAKMNLAGRDYSGLGKKALELIRAGRDLPTLTIRASTHPSINIPGLPLLNVKNNQLIEAVKKARSMLFQPEVLNQLSKNNEDFSFSLIIQKMANTDSSGVAYTKNPVNGEQKIVIESIWGFGTGLSELQPDKYEVNPSSMEIMDKKINEQKWMYGKDFVTGEIIKKPVSNAKANSQVLNDEQIKEVAGLAKKVGRIKNSDQAVWWGFEGSRLFTFNSEELIIPEKEEVEKTFEKKVFAQGEAASPGIISGKAKIIRGEEDVYNVEMGDVIIAKTALNTINQVIDMAGGVIIEEGGISSDVASLCRQLSKPCITGVPEATTLIKDNQIITINGFSGKIFAGTVEEESFEEEALAQVSYTDYQPTQETGSYEQPGVATEKEETLNHVSLLETKSEEEIEVFEPKIQETHPKLPQRPWHTEDIVTATNVYVNVLNSKSLEAVHSSSYDGIGILNLDKTLKKLGRHPNWLLFHRRGDEYSEVISDEIIQTARTVQPKPVFVSFTDLDSQSMKKLKGGEEYEPEEDNPLIGWRGASKHVHKNFEQAFRLECRAIKKARSKGFNNVHAIIPFARTVSEVEQMIKIMREEGLERGEDFKVNVKVDAPSLLFSINGLKDYCDGVCVNLESLTQTLFAHDTGNLMLKIHDHKKPLMNAVKHLIENSHKNGLDVTVCTDLTTDKELLRTLIESGADALSSSPNASQDMKRMVEHVERQIMLKKLR